MTGKAFPTRLATTAACLLLGGGAFALEFPSEEAKGLEQMRSLLKMKPELAISSPELAPGQNALDALVTWMEKDYPLVRDDTPVPILGGIELWSPLRTVPVPRMAH